MKNTLYNFRFILALVVSFTLLTACGKVKEMADKENEKKKEETKTETTTKEETKSGGNKIMFSEAKSSYDCSGDDKASTFYIPSKGGYLTVLLSTGSNIGVGVIDLRVERKAINGYDIISTSPYDVNPDHNCFYFDKVTFHKSGDYKITAFKKDGTPIANGTVRIEFN
jgi:hypothetical protein